MKGIINMSQNNNIENMTDEEIQDLLKRLNSVLMTNKEVSQAIGWTASKLKLYADRGAFAAPIGYIAGKPVWTKHQIKPYTNKRSVNNNDL